MIQQIFEEEPESKEVWEAENTMDHLAQLEDFRGAALMPAFYDGGVAHD